MQPARYRIPNTDFKGKIIMPNLCENRMSVLGDKNDTDAFRERHITEENKGLDFGTVVKMPEILKKYLHGEDHYRW
jgi:hypothetical protein